MNWLRGKAEIPGVEKSGGKLVTRVRDADLLVRHDQPGSSISTILSAFVRLMK